jgi:tetratricopeptide (TPR) repeat protein
VRKAIQTWVSVFSLVLGLAAVEGCARTPAAKRDKSLAAGKKLVEKKDYVRAILEFRNAVQAVPNDPDAHYQLGSAYAASGDARRAYLSFSKAVELNPGHRQARIRLAQLLALAKNPADVKTARERLMELDREGPGSAEILNSLALTELKLGEANSAIGTLQQALGTSPQELSSSILLALARLSTRDTQGAEAALKQACANAPKSADARLALAHYYTALGKLPVALAEFQLALSLDPDNHAALFNVAKMQNTLGQKREAEANFKRLAGSSDKMFKAVHALFLFGEGRGAEAVPEFERLARADSSDRQARTWLVAAYQRVGRTQDAQTILDQALKKNPRDAEALLQRGELYQATGKYSEARRDLTDVLRQKPDSAELHYVISKLHQASGETLTQRQELAETLRLNPNLLAARLELANLLLGGRDSRAALAVLDEAPVDQKGSAAILQARNWALWTAGDLAEMRKGIDTGLALARSVDFLIQDGLWKLRTGNASGGQVALEEALNINPADVRALAGLENAYVARKAGPAVIVKVREYVSRQPKSAPAQEFLGTLLARNGDRAHARAAFEAAKAADPRFVSADFSLTQLDVLEGKWDEARNRLKATLSVDGRNAKTYLWLSMIEESVANHGPAIAYLHKAVELDPANSHALNNLAYSLAEHANNVNEALPYAERACELDPDQPAYADTLGWILYRKGLYSLAVKRLENAASGRQTDALTKYHLAMAYAKAGDADRGRAFLKAALKLDSKLPEARMALNVVGPAR